MKEKLIWHRILDCITFLYMLTGVFIWLYYLATKTMTILFAIYSLIFLTFGWLPLYIASLIV